MHISIQQLLPHRPPFLFVDEVVELTAERAVTRWRVDPAAEFFKGHYPGNPITPGVILCEAIFQAGAILASYRSQESQGAPQRTAGFNPRGSETTTAAAKKPRLPVVTRIKDAQFKRIVKPGELLDIEVQIADDLDTALYMNGWIRVDGELALRISFAVMQTEVQP
ncbi:MAG: 3-hydroxyacyl-[acyl-carrier-protein] dehydratase FabZ [Phycisphaerae bacterium]|nr:3-hydroxyacyl-[acyl-carrier-protein] dehydratase FabZ [Phycisphaerae bacterium]